MNNHQPAKILVVGGGFAGVWSAAGAARLRQIAGKGPRELAVTLIAKRQAPQAPQASSPRRCGRRSHTRRAQRRTELPARHPLGKVAGHNAAAELLGYDVEPFAAEPYVTCLDLGVGGALFTSGWARTVEMTGFAAKAMKRRITRALIYPPVGDGEEFLRRRRPRRRSGASGAARTRAARCSRSASTR